MEAIFLKILNMSITASWLVLAIVILRLILKKAPKAIAYLTEDKGGTAYTVDYAQKHGLVVYNIADYL